MARTPTALTFDLIGQRAAAIARMDDMERRIADAKDDTTRAIWVSMLGQYRDAMPSIDHQIADSLCKG